MAVRAGTTVDVYDTSGELDPSEPIGQLALTLDPLTIWVFTATGYVAVGSPSGTASPSVASESGPGTVELASQAEVEAGTAGVLVANVARLKAALDRRNVAASETVAGVVELATAAEAVGGTDATRAVHPAGLKAAITSEAWIAPTLVNSWVNFGSTYDTAGYRKNPLGMVELKGLVKDGSAGGNAIFTLPVGYRPAADKRFASIRGGSGMARIDVRTSGAVEASEVFGDNTYLSLEGVRFSV
jgi:hypothetical protein